MVSSSGMRQNLAEKKFHRTLSKVSYLFVTRTYKLQFVLIKKRADVESLSSNAAVLFPSPRVPGTRGEGNKAAALEAIES